MSVPALNVDQARQLAADEYRGFGPDDFELVDEGADPDPEAYPDPVDSDRPINEHDIWMLKVAMRKGSRAGLQSHYSRKNPTDRTLGLLLDEWDDPVEIPLDDREALQQADGIGPHRAAQVVGAAVSNRLIERACRPGEDESKLVTDGGQPVEDDQHPTESLMLHFGERGPVELEVWDYNAEEATHIFTEYAASNSESVDLTRDLERAGYQLVSIDDTNEGRITHPSTGGKLPERPVYDVEAKGEIDDALVQLYTAAREDDDEFHHQLAANLLGTYRLEHGRQVRTDGGQSVDVSPNRRREEQTHIGDHPDVDGITRGTVIEYDDWQWAVVTEVATDEDPTRVGFVLLDELGDGLTQTLESAWGCWEHYIAVESYREGEHEYWTDAQYITTNDIWTVLGPVHPDARSGGDEFGESRLVTDGGHRPPCDDVAHMDSAANYEGLERRVCPNCRLYFDTENDSETAFCSATCRQRYGNNEPRTDGGTPSLDALDDGELIRCENPSHPEVWFYDLVDGEVVRYHSSHDFERDTVPTRAEAENSISSTATDAEVVSVDVLGAHQRKTVATDGGHNPVDHHLAQKLPNAYEQAKEAALDGPTLRELTNMLYDLSCSVGCLVDGEDEDWRPTRITVEFDRDDYGRGTDDVLTIMRRAGYRLESVTFGRPQLHFEATDETPAGETDVLERYHEQKDDMEIQALEELDMRLSEELNRRKEGEADE
jgi:hypothetical protein